MTPGPGKNKSGSSGGGSGLKILWIPGRRKHHDKGVYKPTKKSIEHKHEERKNEPWSLGGTKAHDEIIAGKDDEKIDILSPTSSATTSILPSASLGVAAVNIDDHSESENEIKLEKVNCILRNIEYKKYNIRDSIQSLTSTDHNNSTQSAGDGDEKRSAGRTSTQKDYDSIECLDDLDGEPKQNGKKPMKSTKKKTNKEDKAVNCLYYTMMCCECTIS